jgi:hypothetical protein
MTPNWKAAYDILMDYWDFIPEEERKSVDKKLRIALNEQNSPSKVLSTNLHSPPKDCIKNALKRLKDQCGFGIPDKSEEWKKDPIVLKALKEEFK